MADNKFSIDYAKTARSGCKKCKAKIDKGEVRIAKITANPFSEDGEMKLYHHSACIFETFKKARATTKIIDDPGDLQGWEDIKPEDQENVLKLIRETSEAKEKGGSGSKKAPAKKAPAKTPSPKKAAAASPAKKKTESESSPKVKEEPVEEDNSRPVEGDPKHKDNAFREFRRLCAKIADEPSYNNKTEIVRKFFKCGTEGKFQGDLYVWARLLIPGVVKRVYNLQSKQIIKIFSRIFSADEEEMLEDLEKGDVAETVAKFFEDSKHVKPTKKSDITMHEVDNFLQRLTGVTREEDQKGHLSTIASRCTTNDLKMVIRLIKGDLRITAGAKHILEGIHKDAYDAFNSSRNIMAVLDKVIENRKNGRPDDPLSVGATLMHPVQPMLAMACKSVDMAFQKCPNGMYSEIKYDGERVQLHKKGDEFKYFSRSLKPVMPHKVKVFKDYIPKAFPDGSDLILDAEVLMVDNKTGDPLPFGTLGVHKAAGFKDATPCLFVFDCIYYNGESLMNKTMKERRALLQKHMVEVGNHVRFSEIQHITKKQQLGNMIQRVLKQGLEGLVLKDLKSQYEPGKRHWLKVKKDYLNEGAMADSADLVVLGAWYGTGKRGSIMSVWLMGTYDERRRKWCTVTKVHTGLDDATLDKAQEWLSPKVVKIKQDYDKVPDWLECTRQMTPDFVAKDPKAMPVWEITGAEFTKSEIHTAEGLSIRFPRITKRRDDKTWETATNLSELKNLYKVSKEANDFDIDYASKDKDDEGFSSSKSTPNTSVDKIKEEVEEDEEDVKPPAVEVKMEVDEDEKENKTEIKKEVVNEISGRHSYNKTHIVCPSGFELKIVKGDLFKAGEKVSLAHCISKDCKLGKGIAKLFREKFGRVSEIEKMNKKIGEVAPLKVGSRFVYNLVTKAKYSDKPTYESLRLSLEAMRAHAAENSIKEIAMPKIGCGLDGLSWNAVRTLLKNVLIKESGLKITVYSLDDPELDKGFASPVKNASPAKKRKSEEPLVKTELKKPKVEDVKAKEENEEDEEDEGAEVDADLPDVFEDCVIRVLDGVPDKSKLRRYVVAFGGESAKEDSDPTITHFVHGTKKLDGDFGSSNKKAIHVKVAWLKLSVSKKKMQPVKKYQL